MRILVLNPGKEDTLDSIVTLVNKQVGKSQIEICFCLSTFPSQDDEVNAKIPIYCLGSSANPIGLGRSGVHTVKTEKQAVKVGLEMVEQPVDILFTENWPRTIAHEQQNTNLSSMELDSLLETVPRYWFSSGNGKSSAFLERQPFTIDGKVCRFISLAKKGTGRWFYAFSLPFEDDVSSILTTPLIQTQKRKANNDQNSPAKKRLHAITPEECFLCPANPKFETQLIIDKSPNAYISITKGPLGLDNGKGFIGHGMIVPIEHSPILPRPLQDSLFYEQCKRYEKSLISMFTSDQSTIKNSGSFALVTWQTSNEDQVHAHLQFLPILKSQALALEKTIKNQIDYDIKISKKKGLSKSRPEFHKFEPNSDLNNFWSIVNSKSYIYFGLNNDKGLTRFLLTLEENEPVDNLFARKTIAVLINQKSKVNWRNCTRGIEFEQNECNTFKKHYSSI